MKWKRNIKGFTMVELLVTMSLSAVAIACAYMAYTSVFGSFANYQKMNTELKAYTNLCRFTQKLMHNASLITTSNDEVRFINADGYTTRLTVSGTIAVLQAPEVMPDSFPVRMDHISCFFDQAATSNGPVTRIKLHMKLSEQPFSFTFEKLYDSEMLMQLDSIHVSHNYE